MSSPDRFYEELPSFERFNDFVDFATYRPVPEDWVVMLSDVVGSTSAIGEGRYKEVNMIGAASITAVLNACGQTEVPFVFGGDGATLVVPGALAAIAGEALLNLQSRSQTMFGLVLRVGAVPVADLRAAGFDVRVRKYRLSAGNHLAMLAGGGLEEAERLIKDEETQGRYLLRRDGGASEPDLDGLSCRWEPLQPKNGLMMNLMIQGAARGSGEGRVLGEVLDRLSRILGHGLQDAAPASTFSLRFRWPPKGAALEARATAGNRPFWRRYAEVMASSLIQHCCDRFGLRAGAYDPARYPAELRSNTDFRKYDGVLRIVLDVTKEQAGEIEAYLEQEHRAGRLVYGTHTAPTALMTCLVFNLGQGEHVHFIDGSDGGFAVAAKDFKQRRAAAP